MQITVMFLKQFKAFLTHQCGGFGDTCTLHREFGRGHEPCRGVIVLPYSLTVKFLPQILSIIDLQFVGYRHNSLCTMLASR